MSIADIALTDQNASPVNPHVPLGYFLFQTGQLTVTVDMGNNIADPPASCSIIPAGQTSGLSPDSDAVNAASSQKWDFVFNNVPHGCGQTLQVHELPPGSDVCTLDLEVVFDINSPDCPAPLPVPTPGGIGGPSGPPPQPHPII